MSLSKISEWLKPTWVRTLLAVGLVLALVSVALIAADQSYQQHVQTESDARPENRESDTFALQRQEDGTYELHYQSAEKAEVEDRFAWRTAEEWIAILTGALVIFTLTLGIFTAFLWTATKEAVEDARESGERELRAYMSVRDMEVRPVLIGNQRAIDYQIEIENCGKTPAYRCCAHISWAVFDAEPRNFGFYDVYTEDIGISVFDVGPGQNTKLTERLPSERFREIALQNKYCLMWGWVEYNDVFPKSPRRRTEFAYRIRVENRTDNFATWGSHYRRYNNSDQDCLFSAMSLEERLRYWTQTSSE